MLKLRHIDSLQQLRAAADALDALWQMSEIRLPTKRAAMLDQWLEHFAKGRRFHLLGVERGKELVAALPLVAGRAGGFLCVGKLPVNSWSSAGDLLLNENCDHPAVLACLLSGVRELPWPLLWFDTVESSQPRWQALAQAACKAALPVQVHYQFDLGLVHVGDDWQHYQSAWSKNHRKDVQRCLRKAQKQGTLRLDVYDRLAPDDVRPRMIEAFEVEDRSWKGPQATSVLRSPGVFDFYLQQARHLAADRHLRISMLRLDDWPIAFEYGYRCRGVYFSHKVGFDEAYRELSPGQLLMMMLLERDHQDSIVQLTNCMGMLTAATAKWCTHTRPIGRMVIGTGGTLSRTLMAGYKNVWPAVRSLRGKLRPRQSTRRQFKLGATAALDGTYLPQRERSPAVD